MSSWPNTITTITITTANIADISMSPASSWCLADTVTITIITTIITASTAATIDPFRRKSGQGLYGLCPFFAPIRGDQSWRAFSFAAR
jgi:hypothetical protein